MIFSELAYALVSGLVPTLGTPRCEAWCRAVGEGLTARRLGAIALTGLLLFQPQPAQAQTTDFAALTQRATEFLKTEWRALKTFTNEMNQTAKWTEGYLRDAALSYKAYQQSQAMYRRVSGRVDIALVQSLPTLDIETDAGSGDTEHVTIRPIFREQDRNPKFSGKRINVSAWGFDPKNFRNIDFDIDRFIVKDKDPDEGKTADEIRADAVADASQSWAAYQAKFGVAEENQSATATPGYQNMVTAYSLAYTKRTAALQRNVQKAMENFGEDSPEYKRQLAVYADWLLTIARGQAKTDAERATAEMQNIDDEAHRQLESYAVASATMRLANQRRRAADKNRKEADKRYRSDQDDPISSLDKWFGFSRLATTLSSIGSTDKKAVDAPNREMLGNAIKQNIHQESVATDLAEANQAKSRDSMTAAQDKMANQARRKALVDGRLNAKVNLLKGADAVEGLRLDLAKQGLTLEAQLLASKLPEGVVLVLPRPIAAAVPGALTPDKIEQAIATSFDNASQKATDSAASGVTEAFTGPPIGWGFLTSWVKGFGAGFRALTGKSFDLTRMGVE